MDRTKDTDKNRLKHGLKMSQNIPFRVSNGYIILLGKGRESVNWS